MKQKTIAEKDASSLLTRDEDHFFDRKSLLVNGRTIQKIAVAFANSDGGEFVVGIADVDEEPLAENRWKGAMKIEDFNGHLQALSEIKPSVPVDVSILDAPGRSGLVLLVRVEKSSEVHQTSDGTVYIRTGAQSLPLKDQQRILALQFAKGAASFEDQTLTDVPTEEISDSAELGRFLSEYSPKTDPLEFALNQNLVLRQTWEPRVCGILLFSGNPAAIVPKKCSVKIARYETSAWFAYSLVGMLQPQLAKILFGLLARRIKEETISCARPYQSQLTSNTNPFSIVLNPRVGKSSVMFVWLAF